MLKIMDQAHFDRALEFARSSGRLENFNENIKYLDEYAGRDKTECQLWSDPAPHSFYFVMHKRRESGETVQWFNGGLIFHGHHDGGGDGGSPTFSVCLTPTDGWSVHT